MKQLPARKDTPVYTEGRNKCLHMQNSEKNKLYTLLGPGYQEGGGYLSPYEGDQAINQIMGE